MNRAQQILDYLRRNAGCFTPKAVAEALDIDHEIAKKMLVKLRKQRKISRVARGLYCAKGNKLAYNKGNKRDNSGSQRRKKRKRKVPSLANSGRERACEQRVTSGLRESDKISVGIISIPLDNSPKRTTMTLPAHAHFMLNWLSIHTGRTYGDLVAEAVLAYYRGAMTSGKLTGCTAS